MKSTTCRLTPFYAVPIEFLIGKSQHTSSFNIYTKWGLNLRSIYYLESLIRHDRADFQLPDRHNLQAVDAYLIEYLGSSPGLGNRIIEQLYRSFEMQPLDPIVHQIWIGFINYMAAKLATHLWHRMPIHQRTEDRFDRLRSAALISPHKLFDRNFNPEYDPDLLTGIERWTYRVLSNTVASRMRGKEPFFGLSDLGIVRKATLTIVRDSLWDSSSDKQLDRDRVLVKIFKEYLKRSQVRVDRITENNWIDIEQQCHRQWHQLEQDLPPPSMAEIKNRLKFIGERVRYFASPNIDSLDRPCQLNQLSMIVQPRANSQPLENEPMDDEWLQANGLLFKTIESMISELEPIDLRILQLACRDGIKNQQSIGKIVGKDQSTISRKLRHLTKTLLLRVHSQIPHPDGSTKKITSEAIAAIEAALTIFWRARA
jgi:hypothetical protein